MSDPIDWSQFASAYKKFETPGDSIVGTIVAAGVGEYMGKTYPELTLETDEGATVIVSCSQAVLKGRIADLNPQIGNRLAITYTGDGIAKANQNPPKLFDVAVGDAPVAAAPVAPASAPVETVVPTAVVPAPVAPATPSAASLL